MNELAQLLGGALEADRNRQRDRERERERERESGR